MTESQIGEYQELININLNKIKRQVNQIEPGGGNEERLEIIREILEATNSIINLMLIQERKHK